MQRSGSRPAAPPGARAGPVLTTWRPCHPRMFASWQREREAAGAACEHISDIFQLLRMRLRLCLLPSVSAPWNRGVCKHGGVQCASLYPKHAVFRLTQYVRRSHAKADRCGSGGTCGGGTRLPVWPEACLREERGQHSAARRLLCGVCPASAGHARPRPVLWASASPCGAVPPGRAGVGEAVLSVRPPPTRAARHLPPGQGSHVGTPPGGQCDF